MFFYSIFFKLHRLLEVVFSYGFSSTKMVEFRGLKHTLLARSCFYCMEKCLSIESSSLRLFCRVCSGGHSFAFVPNDEGIDELINSVSFVDWQWRRKRSFVLHCCCRCRRVAVRFAVVMHGYVDDCRLFSRIWARCYDLKRMFPYKERLLDTFVTLAKCDNVFEVECSFC